MSGGADSKGTADARSRRGWRFPGAVTTLAIVTLLVWVAAIFIPPGQYARDADGAPIPGTYAQIESSLTAGERVGQLLLAPVNGIYGLLSPEQRIVDTEAVGRLFGQIGVIVFIMAVATAWVLRYAARVRADPSASLVGFEPPTAAEETAMDHAADDLAAHRVDARERLSRT